MTSRQPTEADEPDRQNLIATLDLWRETFRDQLVIHEITWAGGWFAVVNFSTSRNWRKQGGQAHCCQLFSNKGEVKAHFRIAADSRRLTAERIYQILKLFLLD